MNNFDKKIAIVGASGAGKDVLACLADCIEHLDIDIKEFACFVETADFCKTNKQVLGVSVIEQETLDIEKYNVVVAIGDSIVREKVVEKLPKNTKFATIVHPSAIISKWTKIGEGSVIAAGCILTADVHIGKHTQLNLQTTIAHDCKIGNYFTSAPGATINGNCTIGNNVYFGSVAATRQGVSICDNSVIGMGAIVLKDITEAGVYIGIPARKLNK